MTRTVKAATVAGVYDPIRKFATRVEDVNDPGEIDESLRDLQEETAFAEFKKGSLLARVQANPNWWKEKGFQSFEDWMESVHGIDYRKGMYLIEIYKQLLLLGVPYSSFESIGWTRILALLQLPVTNENLKEWVELAKSITVLSLQAMSPRPRRRRRAS